MDLCKLQQHIPPQLPPRAHHRIARCCWHSHVPIAALPADACRLWKVGLSPPFLPSPLNMLMMCQPAAFHALLAVCASLA